MASLHFLLSSSVFGFAKARLMTHRSHTSSSSAALPNQPFRRRFSIKAIVKAPRVEAGVLGDREGVAEPSRSRVRSSSVVR